MQLILVNYDAHYEIEQLSRMFFRPLTLVKTDRRPRGVQEDFVYIRKTAGRFFVCLVKGGEKSSVFVPVRISENPDMDLCIAAYRLYEKSAGKGGIFAVVMGQIGILIGEVAASVAGG